MTLLDQDRSGLATRGMVEDMRAEIISSIENGQILIPQIQAPLRNIAGGVNHCPDSDFSYSKMAATVIGTLPGTAGDTNLEAYRAYRQQVGANVSTASAAALKATGHSLFAANEGATPAIPIWDRVNGWLVIGAMGASQYDVAIQLLSKLVGPGQRWFVRFRCAALDSTIVPANVQVYAGIWQKGGSEGWVQGSAFDLSHEIYGVPGATSIDYRVLAKTDSGVSILSNVLNVPNAPAVLSPANYIKLFYNAGPGFIEFQVFKLVGGIYSRVHTVRNSTDLQFNDIGVVGTPENGWPAGPGNAPLAYAETRNLAIGAFGGSWSPNDLTLNIPSTYNFSLTNNDGQFLRIGLTNPTGVDQHLGIDRIWLSTTYNEWAPDDLRLSDGTAPIPSISPTSGNQGAGEGVIEPPPGGSGGGTCVLTRMPVLVRDNRRLRFKRFTSVRIGDELKGEHRMPYVAIAKRSGVASEYFVIKTKNGITYECNSDHRITIDVVGKQHLAARHVEVGMKLPTWVKGRVTFTTVMSKQLIPEPAEVGTFTLRHPGGLSRDGAGLFIAGRSRHMDRGLFCSNAKPESRLLDF